MKVVICGAGIAGLTLAWWLERAGWDVVIVEKASGPRTAGYMIDFFGSGYDVAELMGLLPQLDSIHYPIPEVAYVDQTGRRLTGLNYATFSRMQRGRLRNFTRGELERVLREALPSRIDIRYAQSIEAIQLHDDRVEVVLSDGAREIADLLVGADGIHSRVRSLVFGPEQRFLRYLGAHTAAYIFEDQQIRQALQGSFRMISAPGREAGFYPISHGRVAAFFAHRAGKSELPASPQAELQRIYSKLGWVVPKALTYGSDGIYYDTIAQIELPHWSHGRVTLVGDACQAVSLLAGQGASMAMGGAYVLSQMLAAHPIPTALARYEDYVKPIILKKQAIGRRTANWIVPQYRWHIWLRNTILRLGEKPAFSWLLKPVLASGSESVVKQTAVG